MAIRVLKVDNGVVQGDVRLFHRSTGHNMDLFRNSDALTEPVVKFNNRKRVQNFFLPLVERNMTLLVTMKFLLDKGEQCKQHYYSFCYT